MNIVSSVYTPTHALVTKASTRCCSMGTLYVRANSMTSQTVFGVSKQSLITREHSSWREGTVASAALVSALRLATLRGGSCCVSGVDSNPRGARSIRVLGRAV